ncbi:hypothetical protein J4E80_000114 [Alternaria sp. BMP 0032]|nr:hypothetical protein J4E80_000114 [Alternaria sp. BMP 0032]
MSYRRHVVRAGAGKRQDSYTKWMPTTEHQQGLAMPDGRERQPYLSKGWRNQLDSYEKGLIQSTSEFPRHCFYFCWPNKDSINSDNWKAGRVGYICDPQWAHTIYPYLFDGDWRGDGASLQPMGENTKQLQAQLADERPKFIKKNGPPVGGGMAREWSDSGKNVTREEIGLPKPVQLVVGTPPDEIKKIELLLDSLATGLPEVSVHGRRTWVDPPPGDQEEVGDLAAFIRGE